MDSRPSKSKPRVDFLNPMNMKRSSSSNSDTHHSQLESPHSPLRFHSPLRSDLGDPSESPPYSSPINSPRNPTPPSSIDNSKAIVSVDNFTQYTPQTSPLPPSTNNAATNSARTPPPPPPPFRPGLTTMHRVVKEEAPQSVRKVGPEGGRSGSILRQSGREETMRLAELCLRISELVLCLISFSVMAADKTQGWSGDSFDRYKEYRYCLSVNVIGFAYASFQAYDLGYHMATGKHVIRHHLRWQLNFFIDQASSFSLRSSLIMDVACQ
ncbi:CASP-like protein 4A3 [Linum perenne]